MTPHEFAREGYAVFPGAIPPDALARLREACDRAGAAPSADGDLDLGDSRRFLAGAHESLGIEDIVLGPAIAQVTRACLGEPGFLFFEQFVVKGAGKGASFAWHQDGAYVGFDHRPYLTVWIALDDATEENGCVYLLPRDLDARPGLDPHDWQEDTKELNGYFGADPGQPMLANAGDIVAFSSLTLHRSGPNRTDRPRRAYVTQYSAEPLIDPATGAPKRFAKPLAA